VRQPNLVNDSLSVPLLNVQKLIATSTDEIKNEGAKAELADIGRRLRDARLGVASFLELATEDHVYWAERGGGDDGRPVNVTLQAAPLDISERLSQIFFRRGSRCILTSATLGVGDDQLRYFRHRVGAGAESRSLVIGSPFDYEKQMTLYFVRSIVDPRDSGYEKQLGEWIRHFLDLSKAGRSSSSPAIAPCEPWPRCWRVLREEEVRSLRPGPGESRTVMLDQFKKSGRGVLLGTDSFWTE